MTSSFMFGVWAGDVHSGHDAIPSRTGGYAEGTAIDFSRSISLQLEQLGVLHLIIRQHCRYHRERPHTGQLLMNEH